MGFAARQITERTVLVALITGFALVLCLLGAAGFVAVRDTRALERDTGRVVREQLLMARLLNDVQAGQNTMAAVLHQLTHMPDSLDRPALLHDLEAADRALERVAASTGNSPEAAIWRDLQTSVRAFSATAHRAILTGGSLSGETLSVLFDQHDRVVRQVRDLLSASSKRVAEADAKIEKESRQLASESAWLLGACLALALLCAALTILYTRHNIRRIRSQGAELSRVSWHLLETQETTARRFSHELHDELGQSLAVVKASLTFGGPKDSAANAECVRLVDEAIANIRELSQLLRPVILDDFGLDAGLKWLTERFAQRTGIAVDYSSTWRDRLADQTETNLFRIAQEALTNVARHSGASRVLIELDGTESTVHLAIEDNGRGMPQHDLGRTLSLGMTGMRARARHGGGELTLSTPEGGGLRIDVWVSAATPEELQDGTEANSHIAG